MNTDINKWVPTEPDKKEQIPERYVGENTVLRTLKLVKDLSDNVRKYNIHPTIDVYPDGTGSFFYPTPRLSILYAAEMGGGAPDADMISFLKIFESDRSEMTMYFTDPKKAQVSSSIEVSSAKDGFEFSETKNPATARAAITRTNEMLDSLEYLLNKLKSVQ